MARTPSAYVFLLLAVLFWSGNFVLGRAFHADIAPVALNYLRWVLVGVLLLPLAWRQVRDHGTALRAHWKVLLLLGVLGIATYNTLVYMALSLTNTFNAVVMMSATPVAIPLFDFLLNRRRLTVPQAVGIAVSLLGVTIIVFQGDWARVQDLRFGTGEVIMVGAMLVWALYSVLLRRAPSGVSSLGLLAVTTWIGVAVLSPFYVWEFGVRGGASVTMENTFVFLYVALFAALGAYLLWNKGVAAVGPVKAGLFIHLLPVFSALLAYVFLGETLFGYHAVGVGLILIGLIMTARSGRDQDDHA